MEHNPNPRNHLPSRLPWMRVFGSPVREDLNVARTLPSGRGAVKGDGTRPLAHRGAVHAVPQAKHDLPEGAPRSQEWTSLRRRCDLRTPGSMLLAQARISPMAAAVAVIRIVKERGRC